MKKAAPHAHRPRPARSHPDFVELLEEASDACASIAALAQLLGHDPSEATKHIGILLYREAGRLHDSLHELERHPRRNRT